MAFSRTSQNPISSWDEVITAGAELSSANVEDAMKEMENAMQNLWQHSSDAGLITESIPNYLILYSSVQLFTFLDTTSVPNVKMRILWDAIRAEVGLTAFTYSATGPLKLSVALFDEIRRSVGLSIPEVEFDFIVEDPAGGVVKVFGAPDTYRFSNTQAEVEGAPQVINGTKSMRRLIQFPESTRKSGVENVLILNHGGGGGYTGNQTWSIFLADYDPGDAEATYNSDSTTFVSGIATSSPSTLTRVDKITGYPASGSGPVYLIVSMDDDSNTGATDQTNIRQLLGGVWPEVRLWQPELS